MHLKPFYCLLLLSFPMLAFAQTPTIQDCLGAISVCDATYSEDQSPVGDGNYPDEVNTTISCTDAEKNSIWYTFTTDQTGDFGFLITPNNPDDDYDWALFDITNAACEDIALVDSLLVSCNAAGGGNCQGPTGANGGSIYDLQGAGCFFSPPDLFFGNTPFNDFVEVEANKTYVLMVSNWSGSVFGYEIDFDLAEVSVFDEEPPEAVSIMFPEGCDGTAIELLFNEFIQCNSVDVTTFQLQGPGGPYDLTLSSTGCDNGGNFDKKFSLLIDPPLTEIGVYTLQFNADGMSDFLDLCDNPAQAATFEYDLTYAPPPDIDLGPDTAFCGTQPFVLLNATADLGTYSWQDGSADSVFTVLGGGIYAVTATNGCGTDTDSIVVFELEGGPEVELGQDTILCPNQFLVLEATNEAAIYQWQDGSTDSTLFLTQGGSYWVEVTTPCGVANDSINIEDIPSLILNLPIDTTACLGDTIMLEAVNPDADYLWNTGSTDAVLGVDLAGTYSVTVSNVCEERSDTTAVSFIYPELLDLGNDTFLCEGTQLMLDATFPGGTYLWQDSSTNATLLIEEGGSYRVDVQSLCGIFSDTVEVKLIPEITIDLGEDRYLCQDSIRLDATAHPDAFYWWSTQQRDSVIWVSKPDVYEVLIVDVCEQVYDTIELFPCERCEVYMPNIFSPNFDGINDIFQPSTPCNLINYQLQIFDRWGNRVFESNNPSDAWDGTINSRSVPQGVYIWQMTYQVIENGFPRKVEESGDVTVVR